MAIVCSEFSYSYSGPPISFGDVYTLYYLLPTDGEIGSVPCTITMNYDNIHNIKITTSISVPDDMPQHTRYILSRAAQYYCTRNTCVDDVIESKVYCAVVLDNQAALFGYKSAVNFADINTIAYYRGRIVDGQYQRDTRCSIVLEDIYDYPQDGEITWAYVRKISRVDGADATQDDESAVLDILLAQMANVAYVSSATLVPRRKILKTLPAGRPYHVARKLLIRHLNDEQRLEFRRTRSFFVHGSQGGFIRLVSRHSGAAFIYDENGQHIDNRCAYLPDAPLWDGMLAQKLMIEGDERKWLETALGYSYSRNSSEYEAVEQYVTRAKLDASDAAMRERLGLKLPEKQEPPIPLTTENLYHYDFVHRREDLAAAYILERQRAPIFDGDLGAQPANMADLLAHPFYQPVTQRDALRWNRLPFPPPFTYGDMRLPQERPRENARPVAARRQREDGGDGGGLRPHNRREPWRRGGRWRPW